MSEMGVEGYFDRVLDSYAIMEITQYKYDLKTHTIHALEGGLPEDYGDSMEVKGFEAMDNPLTLVQFNAETEYLATLGCNIYKQVKKGIKSKKVLIPNTNCGRGELNKEESPPKMVKPNIKTELNAFNESAFNKEDFLADSNTNITNKSIKFLLGIGPKCTLDKNNLPKMFKLVAYFCAEYRTIWR